MSDSSEPGNKLSVSIEGNELIDQLSDHNIPKTEISHGNSITTNICTY
jgi:hypothetical protein